MLTQFELVYDVATSSQAPQSALLFGLVAAVGVAVWSVYLKVRGAPWHAGIKFLAVMAAILFVLGLGLRYEQWTLARRTDLLTVEGPLTGHWTDRVRRGNSSPASYWQWEGFVISGVPFAYIRNLEQNYFHNAGPGAAELREGERLRVHYVREGSGKEMRNQILRVERAVFQAEPGS